MTTKYGRSWSTEPKVNSPELLNLLSLTLICTVGLATSALNLAYPSTVVTVSFTLAEVRVIETFGLMPKTSVARIMAFYVNTSSPSAYNWPGVLVTSNFLEPYFWLVVKVNVWAWLTISESLTNETVLPFKSVTVLSINLPFKETLTGTAGTP